MKEATFRVGLWKIDVIVLHGGSEADFRAYVQEGFQHRLEPASYALGRCYFKPLEDIPPILWVHDLADVATLVHELQHVVFGMLEFRGLKLAPESEEAYTYTTEVILRGILDAGEDGWVAWAPKEAA